MGSLRGGRFNDALSQVASRDVFGDYKDSLLSYTQPNQLHYVWMRQTPISKENEKIRWI